MKIVNPENWHEWRAEGLGGSDIAAIMGLSKWSTPLDVYERKLGLARDSEESQAMKWGTLLEPVVRAEFLKERSNLTCQENVCCESKKTPILRASLDGFLSDGSLLEVKTARFGDDWGEPGTDQIPTHYLTQVMHYLGVTDAKKCYVAVLIGGSDYREYIVERDEEMIEQMQDFALVWWNKHVIPQVPPAPVSYSEAQKVWRKARVESVEASPEVRNALVNLKRVQADKKEIEKAEANLKLEIAEALKDRETLMNDGRVLATWKTQETKRIDTDALKKLYPEIAQAVTTITESRVLRIK